MMDQLQQLKEILAEVYDLAHVAALLEWDQQTYMPQGGAEDRSYQIATISRLAHERLTSDETGRLIEDLNAGLADFDPDSDDAALIRLAKVEYEKHARVPASYVAEHARVVGMAHDVWVRARQEADFSIFQPSLERIVELRRQYASFFAPYDHVYDPLIDDFERGMKTADVKRIFNALRPQQVALIQAIAGRPQVDDSFLHVSYPEQGQWDFGVEVITRFG